MTGKGSTLMQAENEKRRKFIRAVSMMAGLPVLGVGISLLYFAYSETDYLYLFLFVALGLTVTLFGFVLMISGMPASGKKIAVSKPETPEEIKVAENKCPHCNSDIISAGKFCGNCGKPLG